MAGLLKYAVVGAAAGVGSTLVEQARALREEAREEVRFNRDQQQRGEERGFRTSEREATQTFQSGEREASQTFRSGEAGEDRTFRSEEANKARVFQAGETDRTASRYSDRFQRSDGVWMERPAGGGPARPVTEGEGGEPVPGKLPKDPDRMSPTQRRANIDSALREATKKDRIGNEVTDWRAYRTALEARGVDIDDSIERQIQQGATKDAKAQAEREAKGREGYFSNDFGGKTRDEWVQFRTDQIVTEMTGIEANTTTYDRSGGRKPPPEYPDAVWSERVGAFVVKIDGKWHKVE